MLLRAPMPDPAPWTPPFTWAERLKFSLVPAGLYMRYQVRKHLRKGDPELRLLPALVPRWKVAVDVGANKGVYTQVLSPLCTKVYAFEPNPKMFQVLTRPGALPRNAVAYPVALSNAAGTAELIVPRQGSGFSSQHPSLNPRKRSQGHRVVRVETRTLDSYGFTGVGFVKIDVEGFEPAVLQGAAQTLGRERPTVLVEMEERHTGEPIEISLGRMDSFDMAGFFVRHGVLKPLSEFDAERDHRRAVGRPGYVFNFIFRPRELPPPGG